MARSAFAPVQPERPVAHSVFTGSVSRLEADLRSAVRGEVRFDSGSRALYATDASNYRQPPIGVVVARDVEDIVQAVEVVHRHRAPLLLRGCGTSLAGECCNTAVVIDASKYVHGILEIDAKRRRARVEPGVILDHLRAATAAYGLTFGPDPATHDHCTLGGMLGNDSCGVHSVQAEFYGPGARTADNTEELEVLTYDGLRLRVGPTSDEDLQAILQQGGRRAQIYRDLRRLRDRYGRAIRAGLPNIPRRVSGYNLTALLPEHGFNVAQALVGSESTCVTILQATLTLIEKPKARALLVLGYPDVFVAGDHIPEIREAKPIGLEGMDDLLPKFMRKKGEHLNVLHLLPDGAGWLLVEFGGETREEAQHHARGLMEQLGRGEQPPSMRLFDQEEEEEKIWKIRESGLGATAFVPGEPDGWPGWEDSAVPPDRIGPYLRDFRKLLDRHGLRASLYGHFGQGCVHCRISFNLTTADGIRNYAAFTDHATELVKRYGGSISGEHGDGQARGDLLPKLYGDELMGVFREFKRIWDPEWKMNPGKVVDALPRDQELRLGAGYRSPAPPTHFKFPQDGGAFGRAVLRCVGVGKCRRTEGGTMCPSFMALREEQHTTRGRAHLLFEMFNGEVITEGWKSEAVKEALDLCLSCKGCKGECPVNVDMATYKAEFLSHYYEGRLRPRHAYAFGLVHWWLGLAAWAPGVANFLTQTPGLARLAKLAANVAPERRIPRLAPQTFREWFALRPRSDGQGTGRTVLLWPDTFTDHFDPEIGIAAVEALEGLGFHVELPPRICCGRPLFDYGMLDLATRLLHRNLDALRPAIRAGVPLVGLEPSCVSVFRDELVELFPSDEDAKRLKQQTKMFTEFLHEQGVSLPHLGGKALVHIHCHHKSVLGTGPEEAVLTKLGLEFTRPEDGCCGMAGAFGFEREKYPVSMAIGERVLLPAIRRAPDTTLVITDGFSCRHQVLQSTGRRPLHPAEVVALALRQDRRRPALDGYPLPDRAREGALLAAGLLASGGVLAWALLRRTRR